MEIVSVDHLGGVAMTVGCWWNVWNPWFQGIMGNLLRDIIAAAIIGVGFLGGLAIQNHHKPVATHMALSALLCPILSCAFLWHGMQHADGKDARDGASCNQYTMYVPLWPVCVPPSDIHFRDALGTELRDLERWSKIAAFQIRLSVSNNCQRRKDNYIGVSR